MTDPLGRLEERLRSLRPLDVSAGLAERVTRRMEAEARIRLRVRLAWGVAALAAAAALLVAFALRNPAPPPGRPGASFAQKGPEAQPAPSPAPESPSPAALAAHDPADGLPTYWELRRAAGNSPEAVEALLARSEAQTLPPGPYPAPRGGDPLDRLR